MNESNSLLIVIVLYRQLLTDTEAFKSLLVLKDAGFCDFDLAVYDNTELSQNNEVKEIFPIHYFHDSTNPGISKSYNRAAVLAKELKKEWILFLDQDTFLTVDGFMKYSEAIIGKISGSVFVPTLVLQNERYFSPCKFFLKRGKFLKGKLPAGDYLLSEYSFVNSGLLIKRKTFEDAGGYNENVQLDYADFEFIERLKKRQKSFTLLEISLYHSFSDIANDIVSTQKRFLQFLKDLKGCDRKNYVDDFLFFRVVFIRTIKLAIKHRSIYFIQKLFEIYLLPNTSK